MIRNICGSCDGCFSAGLASDLTTLDSRDLDGVAAGRFAETEPTHRTLNLCRECLAAAAREDSPWSGLALESR